VTVTLRAWTSPAGYRDTQFDLIRAVKQRFQAAGLTFAYPHQVAVESRPWTPPNGPRQGRRRRALNEPAPAEPAASANGRSRKARSSGSVSEAKGP
jgi:hypothetical protein